MVCKTSASTFHFRPLFEMTFSSQCHVYGIRVVIVQCEPSSPGLTHSLLHSLTLTLALTLSLTHSLSQTLTASLAHSLTVAHSFARTGHLLSLSRAAICLTHSPPVCLSAWLRTSRPRLLLRGSDVECGVEVAPRVHVPLEVTRTVC